MVLSKSIKREQSPTFWEKFMGANEEKKTGYYYKSEPSKIFDRNSNEFKELKDDFDKNVLHHDRYNQVCINHYQMLHYGYYLKLMMQRYYWLQM